MDSICVHLVHEIDGAEQGVTSTDGHGWCINGRCSLVLMATSQTSSHMSTEFISEALRSHSLADKGASCNRRHEIDFKNGEANDLINFFIFFIC